MLYTIFAVLLVSPMLLLMRKRSRAKDTYVPRKHGGGRGTRAAVLGGKRRDYFGDRLLGVGPLAGPSFTPPAVGEPLPDNLVALPLAGVPRSPAAEHALRSQTA